METTKKYLLRYLFNYVANNEIGDDGFYLLVKR